MRKIPVLALLIAAVPIYMSAAERSHAGDFDAASSAFSADRMGQLEDKLHNMSPETLHALVQEAMQAARSFGASATPQQLEMLKAHRPELEQLRTQLCSLVTC